MDRVGSAINRHLGATETIEGVLEIAIHKAGLVTDANFGDLNKIGFSRASRTDKGVHSLASVGGSCTAPAAGAAVDMTWHAGWHIRHVPPLCQCYKTLVLLAITCASMLQAAWQHTSSPHPNTPPHRSSPHPQPPPRLPLQVFAFKAQLDDASYQGDPEGLAHAQRISQHLPPSVRVMSAQRVNRKFNARHMCLERTYEYWLPQSMIGTWWREWGGVAASCVKMMHVHHVFMCCYDRAGVMMVQSLSCSMSLLLPEALTHARPAART